MSSTLPVAWVPREPPLAPCGVAATGDAARRLLARVGARVEGLAGVVGDDLVVLLGAADALPWVEGVVYLGRDPAADGVLVPTALAPDRPIALVGRAIRARVPAADWPIAVLPGFGLVPLASARPLDAATVAAELARRAGHTP